MFEAEKYSLVINDVTFDLAPMISDIVYQVCRKKGEEKAGARSSFSQASPAANYETTCGPHNALPLFGGHPIHMPLPDHNRGGT